MPEDAQQNKKRSRASRLTCIHCRTKKIRCDGAQPSCGICAAYHKECRYDKPPPMTQVIAMAERIKELERLIDHENSPPTSAPEHLNLGQDVADPHEQEWMQNDNQYESTSAVHAPGQLGALTTSTSADLSPLPLDDQDASRWEEAAVANCAVFLQLPPERVRHLLSTHWAWVHPAFMFVNKGIFLRDAAVGGLYFHPLLLTVICLHSTRFTDHDLNERLSTYAKLLLGQEIHADPSIPTVQAFLQMSASEIGRGAVSRAWLYSGIAFRVALDLGLFNMNSQENGTLEERRKWQVGQKLAWSCFLWDKTMSLYLGRTPTLPNPPKTLTDDDYSIDDIWKPYGVSGAVHHSTTAPSHIETCFRNFCKLAVIVNDILTHVYGRKRTENAGQFVKQTRSRLEAWYQELPRALQLGSNLVLCPNPHILTQNLLYRATIILLFRPFRKIDSCKAECRAAAHAIENLFLALERTFGFSRVTYLMAYCAYTAATVAVHDAREEIAGAQHRVDTLLRVISAIRYSCPGMQRSLDIINQSLVQPAAHIQTQAVPIDTMTLDAMPAFPMNCVAFDTNMPLDNSTAFTDLDAYTSQWSSFPENILEDINFGS